MKVLITYSSRNGVTKQCAEMLASFLPSTIESDVVNLHNMTPDLREYDCAVLGGSVRMEKLGKPLRTFIKRNKDALSEMPSALFICCGFPHLYREYKETVVPRKVDFSLGIHHFGGELKPDKLHGFDKLIVKSMRKSIKEADFEDIDTEDLSLPEIIPENIKLLAESIKNIK